MGRLRLTLHCRRPISGHPLQTDWSRSTRGGRMPAAAHSCRSATAGLSDWSTLRLDAGRHRRRGYGLQLEQADAFHKGPRADAGPSDPAGGSLSGASVPQRPAALDAPAAGAWGRCRHWPGDTPSRWALRSRSAMRPRSVRRATSPAARCPRARPRLRRCSAWAAGLELADGTQLAGTPTQAGIWTFTEVVKSTHPQAKFLDSYYALTVNKAPSTANNTAEVK